MRNLKQHSAQVPNGWQSVRLGDVACDGTNVPTSVDKKIVDRSQCTIDSFGRWSTSTGRSSRNRHEQLQDRAMKLMRAYCDYSP